MRSKTDRLALLERVVHAAYAAGVGGARSEEHDSNGREVVIEGQRLPQIKLMYELFSKAPGALKQMESFMVE